jgi:hypothetical protein
MALELYIVWCGDHENGDNRIGSGGEVKWISCGGLAYMIKQQTDDKGGRGEGGGGVSEVWGASGLWFSEIPEPPPTR